MVSPEIGFPLLSVIVAIKFTRLFFNPAMLFNVIFVGMAPTFRVEVFWDVAYVLSSVNLANNVCAPMLSVSWCDNVVVPVASVTLLPTVIPSTKNCMVFPEIGFPLLSVIVAIKFTRLFFNPAMLFNVIFVGTGSIFRLLVFWDVAYILLLPVTNSAVRL
jgi:hypothetical protein